MKITVNKIDNGYLWIVEKDNRVVDFFLEENKPMSTLAEYLTVAINK